MVVHFMSVKKKERGNKQRLKQLPEDACWLYEYVNVHCMNMDCISRWAGFSVKGVGGTPP